MNYLIDPRFQGVNRIFVLPLENETDKEVFTKYYLPTEEVKDYHVVIDERNLFDQSIKNYFKTYDNITKIGTGQEDDYTTECLLDYNYFKNIAIMLQ